MMSSKHEKIEADQRLQAQHTLRKDDRQIKLVFKTFDRKLFLITIFLFVTSLMCLIWAVHISNVRHHVPFGGVANDTAITSGSSTITVSEVHTTLGSGSYAAPAGKHFVVLTLSIHNNIEKPINVFPTSDTYLKSTDGKVVFLTPMNLNDPFHSGIILPGETTQGELSYLVEDTATYKFYVEASWSAAAIPFSLSNTIKIRS